jgi:hypothetical protein
LLEILSLSIYLWINKETGDIFMAKTKKKWIQKAIKHPGTLTATAKAAGAISKSGTIKRDWLEKQAKGSGVTAKRARLALTLRKMK